MEEVLDPCASDAGLAVLSVELREAFGSGVYDALRPEELGRVGGSSTGAKPAATEEEAEVSAGRLGDFELLGELGRGGMGIVYRARQVSLNREVALKVLPSVARRNRSAVTRFRRESQAAARLHHTNIVPVYAQGEYRGKFYYAMELIEGESLDSALRCDSSVAGLTPRPITPPAGFGGSSDLGRGRVTEEDTSPLEVRSVRRTRRDYQRIAHLLAEVADALEYAHHQGVIHRDIKPHNLLLGRDDRLHITDFGLAHLQDEPHLTLSGEVMGTPAYMSPEQVGGHPAEIDHRTDVYSLGVTLYELLALRRPFEGQTREQVIHRICTDEPPPLRRIDARIPLDLETICSKAMAKEPGGRYTTAAALAEDLQRFAEDRSIRTRRAGPLAKTVKWARRHKAAATAIATGSLALGVTAVLAASVMASRRGEAARLVDNAYAQLVFVDYRDPERVAAELDQAEQLGADPLRLGRLQALVSMSGSDLQAPVRPLEALAAAAPEDVETLYLLAWAYWRDDRHEDSRRRFARAETLGGARTPGEWFFRGLASQFDDSQRAMESYQQARQLRAQQGQFFPQATLHLARARNQWMYRYRRIEPFEEVRDALLELIEYEVYESYPYYLLSIAYRFAGDFYAANEATRPGTAQEYYDQAIACAREAQKRAKPGDESGLAAEAECLESMEDFAEAITARTKALETTQNASYKWENYHYRWRLYYWTGQFEAALDDLKRIAELKGLTGLEPQRFFYTHVYTALVLAESGRLEEALALARAVAEPPEAAPDSASAALKVLWSATCLRLMGRPDEAQQLLEDRRDSVDFNAGTTSPQTAEWMMTLYDYATAQGPFETLLVQANRTPELSRPRLLGEAHFHAGAIKLGSGDRAGAFADWDEAYRSFDEEKQYTYRAKVLRVRLQADPAWPPWISHR